MYQEDSPDGLSARDQAELDRFDLAVDHQRRFRKKSNPLGVFVGVLVVLFILAVLLHG